MKNKHYLSVLFALLGCILFSSCSDKHTIKADYSFEVAKDVEQSVSNFNAIEFHSDKNLDLGFYKGNVWIKLEITNGSNPASYVVLCNDLINHYYRFYKLDTSTQTLKSPQEALNTDYYDHRTFTYAKPNFEIQLDANEKGTFFIATSSDGRILQATPELISLNEFLSIKQQTLVVDIVFYCSIILLLLINLFYFRLIRSDIYYYYGAYILFGCLMYLFVEGRLYGLGWSHVVIDHLMFLSIRIWIACSILFTVRFLETKTTNPKYYRFILVALAITLGTTTLYQFAFADFSISTLHKFENIIGFFWITLSLITVGIAYNKRKIRSIYYLISCSLFLLFVTLGLIDSHTTMLPGDPFSYFKIGTILEFIGFTYFITVLVKQKLATNEQLEQELTKNLSELKAKEQLLATRNTDLVSVFKLVESSFANESDWNDFKERFETLNSDFISSLSTQHPDLSKSETRLLTLVRIGYSQKEIADILNIAPDSVKKARSRARRKLNLDDSVKLHDYLTTL